MRLSKKITAVVNVPTACWLRFLENVRLSRGCGYSLHQHTQIYFFEILLNQTEIRLYLTFSDWYGTKQTSIWFQINRKMVNNIWFWFDLIRFRKRFSVWRSGRISAVITTRSGQPLQSQQIDTFPRIFNKNIASNRRRNTFSNV